MGHKIVIGMVFNQKFENGDVVPPDTAIHGDFCHTVISCVGKAPSNLEFDEPTADINYHHWKKLLTESNGLRLFGEHIERGKKQIVYLNQPRVRTIFKQIAQDTEKMDESYYSERAEWLVFWTTEALKRYSENAAIGLF